MSQDYSTPEEYAAAVAEWGADMRNSLEDGGLGRANGAQDSMSQQLLAAGFSAIEAEALLADFVAQLRRIDRAAAEYVSACAQLPDITEALMAAVRRRVPGFHFNRYTV